MYPLEGKAALITSAARGMGAVDARLFVQQGVQVVLTDIQDDGLASPKQRQLDRLIVSGMKTPQ